MPNSFHGMRVSQCIFEPPTTGRTKFSRKTRMEVWIPITIVAAFMQNARSALQKHLKGNLTNLGAAYVRFLYAWPFALIYLAGLHSWGGMELPRFNWIFLAYSVSGGLAQIIFTVLLMHLFSFRNFAVGTTYSKTEIVQIAILGFLILGDTLTPLAGVAIVIAVLGVVLMSMGQTGTGFRALRSGLTEKPTVIGLVCGAFLGASVVLYRGAALSLDHENAVMAAAYTLAISVVIQTIIMGLYIAIRERQTLIDVFVHWRWSLAVGVTGALASMAWFTAFTLQNAAYVRALGQIELVFTFIASVFFFRERTSRIEVAGIVLVIAGIVTIILTR
jgi:drug/metabolite transporter (DMT)-like permease